MPDLIFVDTETGGLDAESDPLIELTYAPLKGEPHTLWFGVTEVPEFIDDLIGFTKRGIAGRLSPWEEIRRFREVCDGATMVAANPAFDKAFLEREHLFSFHYRMLDVESYAMAKLGLDYVPSMKDLYDRFYRVHSLTEPDHTSRNDVLCMREIFEILRAM